uniref:Uncharacterized protein n=1 Tax=Anopheles quadriannulatus TaxID=34691 RepID=A0A182XS81_ANOQN
MQREGRGDDVRCSFLIVTHTSITSETRQAVAIDIDLEPPLPPLIAFIESERSFICWRRLIKHNSPQKNAELNRAKC